MNAQNIIETARAIAADDKGLLAMDGSNPTCNKRFANVAAAQQALARRAECNRAARRGEYSDTMEWRAA
jgi:fructose-bisphosphate aldolase class I